MSAHVALEVEVGQLLITLQLQQLSQVLIRVDLTTIGLVLQVVAADVGVDLTGNLSPGHLGSNWLLQEGSQLVRDEGRLHETARLAVAGLPLTLSTITLGLLERADGALLEGSEILLQSSKSLLEALDLSGESREAGCKRINRVDLSGLNSLLRRRGGRLGDLSGGFRGLNLGVLLGRGSRSRLSTGHLVYTLVSESFLSVLTQ